MSFQQVVILAGGLGTRLRPLTETMPKPMVTVSGKPFLYWQLLDLKEQGWKKVLLLVSYLNEQIKDYFKHGQDMGLEISYSTEPEPLGSGGAVKWAEDMLEERFLLLNGDSFLHIPLKDMTRSFAESSYDAMIASYDNNNPTPVIPNLKVSSTLILEYKKGGGEGYDLIDSGIYAMDRKVLKDAPDDKFYLESLWPTLIQNKKLGVFQVNERFYDIGTPERLKEFEDNLSDYF